ncbi:MAG: hypothetical protein DHS20C01_23990 [marine bacterium B5-7]|nr:MAG: hypothetical protein DHS20C01_23990 [marine bacterium B5-7]
MSNQLDPKNKKDLQAITQAAAKTIKTEADLNEFRQMLTKITDEAARKVVYLAITDASKKWTMPIHHWKIALNRFMIDFEDRLINHV